MEENLDQQKNVNGEDKIKSFIGLIKPLVQVLMPHTKKIVFLNLFIILCTLTYLLFFVKPDYVSTINILPEYGGKSGLAGLASIASLAGLDVGGGSPMEVYENIIVSESVLEPVIMNKYKTLEYKDSVNLIEYFEVKSTIGETAEDQEREKFLKMYKRMIKINLSIDLDLMSKIMTLKITMPERMLSADVLNRIVLSLDNYIRTKKKSNASNSRFYIEKRISQVKDTLAFYEEKLKSFRESNKVIFQSPGLLLEQERLIREITISGTVFAELQKQLELVKLDEIRDAPVLNVKEFAKDPIIKDGPNRRVMFVVILLVFNVILAVYFMLKMNKDRMKTKIIFYWNLLTKSNGNG